MNGGRARFVAGGLVVALGLSVLSAGYAPTASGQSPPGPTPPAAPDQAVPEVGTGFTDDIAFSGLEQPTVVRFSPDGRVFVAEKSGIIRVFDSAADTTPSVVVDLSTEVHNFWDRGLLGMALSPDFPSDPSIYVLYTFDAAIGRSAPRWGTAGTIFDPCPTPPGPVDDGCVASGRLVRLRLTGNTVTSQQTLIEDWCQQYPGHSVGAVQFGPDGALYASAGEGAGFTFADYGQDGSPVNPCNDPPGAGRTPTLPTAEGGSLRAQDVRTLGDPTGLGGTVIRVDPDTGAGLADNPMGNSSDANARRIVATGFRNPYRFTFEPGGALLVGDVGNQTWEEIDRVPDPSDGAIDNFGWPCYEAGERLAWFDDLDVNLCESLYADPTAVSDPIYTYNHAAHVVTGDGCPSSGASISGLAVYPGGPFPDSYDGALFFADYTRGCIWARPAAGGAPILVKSRVSNPVNLEVGPDGNLYYVDIWGGTVHRVSWQGGGGTGTGVTYLSERPATYATNGWGPVEPNRSNGEDGSGDGGEITLDGVGYDKGLGVNAPSDIRYALGGDCSRFQVDIGVDDEVGDAGTVSFEIWTDGHRRYRSGRMTGTSPTRVIDLAIGGADELRLLVRKGSDGLAGDHADWADARVTCGDGGGRAHIDAPASNATWQVGTSIRFAGGAENGRGRALPASALTWSVVMRHCPGICHSHEVERFVGVAGGTFVAPDHEWPSYLDLRLTAQLPSGRVASDSIQLDPRTVDLTFRSTPEGVPLTVNGVVQPAPFVSRVIIGSRTSIGGAATQTVGGNSYTFLSWSNGGARNHAVTAPSRAASYRATYQPG